MLDGINCAGNACRSLLGWYQDDLAKASGVSMPTIARLETEDGDLGGYAGTRGQDPHGALEKAGVIFVEENGDGPGVRLRKGASVVISEARR